MDYDLMDRRPAMTGDATAANSPLIQYALKGLERCWLAEQGCWSHIYHLDGRRPPNESIPHSDVFYTLNVLLGFARVRNIPASVDVPAIFRRNAERLLTLPVRKYAFGVTLWAAAELGLEIPDPVLRHIRMLLADKANWMDFRAQDLGMILVGVAAQARRDRQWAPITDELFSFLQRHYHCQSGLFLDAARGARRRFGSFATQTYLTLACYAYGELAGDDRAIGMANACARKLISLQGPQGEWPWFFDAPKGIVVDFYEVYSVHQYGMAPAFLEHAERHGVPEARAALVKGFKWVFGDNQLGQSMLVPKLHLSIRSQVRKGELRTNKRRMVRAIVNSLRRHDSGLIDPNGLEVRLECRSYELGWILWSFGQRTDLPELTEHPVLVAALAG
jgi:hypothetical protein